MANPHGTARLDGSLAKVAASVRQRSVPKTLDDRWDEVESRCAAVLLPVGVRISVNANLLGLFKKEVAKVQALPAKVVSESPQFPSIGW